MKPILAILVIWIAIAGCTTAQPDNEATKANRAGTTADTEDATTDSEDTDAGLEHTATADSAVTGLTPEGIPENAMTQYSNFGRKYARGIGATIEKCMQGNETIFAVNGSDGGNTETLIYNISNAIIDESYISTDSSKTKQGTIDLFSYDCTTIKNSQALVPQ